MKTFLFAVFSLLLLSACAECKTAADCTYKPSFQASCIGGKCEYTPLQNVCGNTICEGNENECTCPQDCGQCAGSFEGSQYLIKKCIQGICLADIATQKPTYDAQELSTPAGRFKIETIYNDPFNLKKDLFRISVEMSEAARSTSNQFLVRAEITAQTPSKTTVKLADVKINRPIYEGITIAEDLILDLPGTEGQLQNPMLELTVEYNAGQTAKQAKLQIKYKSAITYVKPPFNYPCADCDDKNPATKDICGPETAYFCKHEPILGMCGNHICESNENKCTCPQDCGPCTGSAGKYTEYACAENKCAATLKPGVQQEPIILFDERKLGPVQLNNKYEFNTPFDINNDKFKISFSIYSIQGASNVKIETIRLMELNQLIAEKKVDKTLSEKQETKAELEISQIVGTEEEKSLSLTVWYSYDQNGETRRGDFTKPLGKITLYRTR